MGWEELRKATTEGISSKKTWDMGAGHSGNKAIQHGLKYSHGF